MHLTTNPVDELLASAARYWRAPQPLRAMEVLEAQLSDAVQLEMEMEAWSQDRWKEERDWHHKGRVAQAKNLEADFKSLKRQQAVCAALLPRYAEGTPERETLRRLLERLKAEHAQMSRTAQVDGKMTLASYRRLCFKRSRDLIRDLGEALTALRAEWAAYHQEQSDLETLTAVLDANRRTPDPTSA
jgi:hypothetical protein